MKKYIPIGLDKTKELRYKGKDSQVLKYQIYKKEDYRFMRYLKEKRDREKKKVASKTLGYKRAQNLLEVVPNRL